MRSFFSSRGRSSAGEVPLWARSHAACVPTPRKKSEKCDVASCGDAECVWGCFQVSETRIQMHLGGTMLRARRVDIRERRVLEELETQMEALRLRFVRLHGEGDSVVSSAGKSYGWLGRWRCCRTCLGRAVDRSAAGGV